ncbi:hypothetical protein GcM3_198040 [Golovinomyces cichoracearum]|uniref:Uncharacterized protein n=1 Tax=Golovinomyces cichoracearum TaxID=62708 RepID=A0A420HFC3_9PEZI|nr:hypothetical protein GcM3_198040 [Golovinomyces cichoracearum]
MTIKPSEILEYDSKSYTEPSSREPRIEVKSLDSVEMANDEVIKLDNVAEFVVNYDNCNFSGTLSNFL